MSVRASLLMLITIMVLAGLATINVPVPVQSYTPPGGWPEGQPYFTLWTVLNRDPYWGLYGGYHDIWYRLQPEFAKIGINLVIYIQGDMYDNWYLIWEAPLGGRPPGPPPRGWDLTALEWWLHPQGMLWMDGLILSKYITPYGSNVFPYLNRKSDWLYRKMQMSFDAERRQSYAWAWQEELMHNPPMINMYYPHVYHVRGRYIQGYDPTVWWYDLSNLRINVTGLEELLPPAVLNRLTVNKTIIYGVAEAWWSYLATFVDCRTEELYQNLVSGTLYKPSLDPWPAEGEAPPPQHYTLKPWLASDFPQDMGWETDPTDDTQVYRVRIPLREGVLWSDGHPFDAQDIKFTYDLILNKYVLSSAYGDFAPIVKRVEYVNATDPEDPNWDPHSIDLILYKPYVDLPLILANTWGTGIIPNHALHHRTPTHLRGSPENKMFAYAKTVPQIGPFVYDSESTPAGYADIIFVRNPNFFGYDLGWGPYDIEKIILSYIPDAGSRFADIKTHGIDFGEYIVAPVEVFEELKSDPTLLVYVVPYFASNGVWMNFNNPNLSNRYVRLALAHAIPYQDIFTQILPSWGIVDPLPGISFALPWQYYTEPEELGGTQVQLFHNKLEPYTYDLVKAKQYLDMWRYSQTGQPHAQGPVGDADFDGIVDLDDLWYWLDEYGNAPLTRPIDWWDPAWSEGVYPWPVESGASVAPGNDIDPDFDNSGTVGPEDLPLWFNNWGKEYPFPEAR